MDIREQKYPQKATNNALSYSQSTTEHSTPSYHENGQRLMTGEHKRLSAIEYNPNTGDLREFYINSILEVFKTPPNQVKSFNDRSGAKSTITNQDESTAILVIEHRTRNELAPRNWTKFEVRRAITPIKERDKPRI